MKRSTLSAFRALSPKVNHMKHPLGTKASTGQSCPESGVWKSLDTPSTTAPIAKGNTMPPHNGKAVTWQLQSYA